MNLDPAPSSLRLLTLNVQGLTSSKFLTVLRWAREEALHILVLTETRLTSDPADMVSAEAGGGTIWPGVDIFHTPGTGHTGGVCVIIGPGIHLTDPVCFRPPGIAASSRVLRIDLQFYNRPVSIVGIYSPAQHTDRHNFYSDTLPSFLPGDNRLLLIAGDFNTVLQQHDCWYAAGRTMPQHNSRYVGRQELRDLMHQQHLVDVF